MVKSIVVILSLVFGMGTAYAQESNVMSTRADTDRSGRLTFSVEPIWLLVSGIGIGASYNISNTSSVDVKAMGIFNHKVEEEGEGLIFPSYRMSREEYNIGMTFMLNGDFATQGIYISPSIGYVSAEITDYGSSKLSGEASSTTARATGGYRWKLSNNLSANAGIGLIVATDDLDVVVRDSSGNVVLEEESASTGGLALDAGVTYTF